jgi:hypothetical protein
MRVVNLPEIKDAHTIECKPAQFGGFEFWCAGSLVARSDAATPKGIAEGLAQIMTEVYRRGFDKGLEHVRDAIGIKRTR